MPVPMPREPQPDTLDAQGGLQVQAGAVRQTRDTAEATGADRAA